jgi:hypothetical protein
MSRPRRLPDAEPHPDVAQLLFFIDTAYDHLSWHGPNLRGSLRGVTPAQAAWRPAPGRHNIWELAVHAAYWKYVAWRRLTGAKRGSFLLGGSNFLVRPDPRRGGPSGPPESGAGLKTRPFVRAWRADLDALHETHLTLRGAIEEVDPAALPKTLPGSGKVTRRALITGIAAHDLYHAGQIQLLKRLRRD